MARVIVPDELANGQDPIVVRVLEEIVTPPPGTSTVTLAVKTVVHVAVVGGGRVGLLAQISAAIATQGLSVTEAYIQVTLVIVALITFMLSNTHAGAKCSIEPLITVLLSFLLFPGWSSCVSLI